MKFGRGFKSYCEATVTQMRQELGLSIAEPIDMEALLQHLDIPVMALSRYVRAAGARRSDPQVQEIYLRVSAVTFYDSHRRTILYNEEHIAARHRSNLAHEIAHALLQHPAQGSGISDEEEQMNEAEAAWMGGVLMLAASQARYITTQRLARAAVLTDFKISPEMLRYRLNVTGASRMYAAA